MWTLTEAQELIAQLQPRLRKLNYHVAIGGGVATNGKSDKDLDLFFLKENGHDGSNVSDVRDLLFLFFNRKLDAIRDSPDYHVDNIWHYHWMEKTEYHGKRIDLFIQG